MKSIPTLLANIAAYKIRIFPLIVLACVLVFPAYKGIGLGYVPVALGFGLAWWLIRSDRIWCQVGQTCSRVRWATWVFLFPAIAQLLLIVTFRPAPWYDGLFVFQHAKVLVATGIMDPMTYYPPAQTWWYAGWFSLFGVSPLVAQLSQIPLSLGVTWMTYRIGLRIGSEVSARNAALAVAWYPTFIGYVLTTPYYHYLYTWMMLAMVWGLVRFIPNGFAAVHASAMLLAGLAAGMGALTKAVQLIAPLQVMVWFFVLGCSMIIPWRKWVIGLVIFGVGMMAVIGPWTWRNWTHFNDIVPVCTSGGLVLYSANNPKSNGLYSDLPDAVSLATPAEMLAHSRWCSDQAKQFIMQDTGRFLQLAARKFLHTWGVEATFTELVNWRGQTHVWMKQAFSAVCVLGWSALVAMWASRALRQMRMRSVVSAFEALAGVLILSNAFVYVIFEGGDRHHLPLVPILILLVASAKVDGEKPSSIG